jgi:hypothetical protein
MAANPPTPRAPSRSAMSANVETGRVDLVLTLEFHATSRAACTVFSGGRCPGLRDGGSPRAVHFPLGTLPIACTIAFTVTSPLFSAAVLGACPSIASRMRVGMPASMPTVLKRFLQRRMGATFGSGSERLTKTVRDAGVTLEDFGRLANEEVIRLSRKWKIGDWRESRIEREWIDYTDTAETNAMRDDVRRVNARLERASITFVDDGAQPVDVRDRTLRRLFVILEGDPLGQPRGLLAQACLPHVSTQAKPTLTRRFWLADILARMPIIGESRRRTAAVEMETPCRNRPAIPSSLKMSFWLSAMMRCCWRNSMASSLNSSTL